MKILKKQPKKSLAINTGGRLELYARKQDFSVTVLQLHLDANYYTL